MVVTIMLFFYSLYIFDIISSNIIFKLTITQYILQFHKYMKVNLNYYATKQKRNGIQNKAKYYNQKQLNNRDGKFVE